MCFIILEDINFYFENERNKHLKMLNIIITMFVRDFNFINMLVK